MALVLSYRLTMEVAAALTLFVDVHRPCKTNLPPNLNIVGHRNRRACLTPRRTDAKGDNEVYEQTFDHGGRFE